MSRKQQSSECLCSSWLISIMKYIMITMQGSPKMSDTKKELRHFLMSSSCSRYSCLSALLYRAAVKPRLLMASTTSLGPSRDVSNLNTWVNT